MTLQEAMAMTPEQFARAQEKDGMVATLDRILDFFDGLPDPPAFLRPQTREALVFASVLLREDILTAAGEKVR
jgi:hypothetical protein